MPAETLPAKTMPAETLLDPSHLFAALAKQNIDYITGVPDSTLKHFCSYLADQLPATAHTICANEGAAIALASGYYLGTGKIPAVYMQNSGLGNSVNPLVSLAAKEVYAIPLLLIIGWRGEPGIKDEPQHRLQGAITTQMLDIMNIPWVVVDGRANNHANNLHALLAQAAAYMRNHHAPFALVVRKNTFASYQGRQAVTDRTYPMSREDALKSVVDVLTKEDITVATTGMAARELFEYRQQCQQTHNTDFLTVGSMGHASMIALGIAVSRPDRRVFCLDGDGALLMHMGSLTTIGCASVSNLVHIMINNGAHDSVGGQATVSRQINVCAIALACGYTQAIKVDSRQKLHKVVVDTKGVKGPIFLEVMVRRGNRSDLGRPTRTPLENKIDFMQNLL